MERVIEIWTDGSCFWKDRIGGWAFAVVENNEIIYEDYDWVGDTTSAVMEMTAGLKAMKYANENFKGVKIHIVTDYATLVNCFKERWWEVWQECNFFDVKNSDLWKEIIKERFSKVNKLGFKKVKGHAGIEFNEYVDFLCGECRKYGIEQLKDDREYHRRIGEKIPK